MTPAGRRQSRMGRRTDAPWLAGVHLLLLPSTVSVSDVDALVRTRVPGSRLALDGEVSLGRASRLVGPFELTMEEAVEAAVPMPWTLAYALQAPVEREDPPLPDVSDRDGVGDAFIEGLPWREEGRVVQLCVSLARRLGGAVRTAGTHRMITPDPQRAVDFTVHAAIRLDPHVLLAVVRRELPTARLAEEGEDWDEPEEMDDEGVLDSYADIYAVVGEVSADHPDGAIEVLVHDFEAQDAPLAATWPDEPTTTYEVRWACPDPAQRERPDPPPQFLSSRERVRPVVRRVTRAIVEATSGHVSDEDAFPVDRYTL